MRSQTTIFTGEMRGKGVEGYVFDASDTFCSLKVLCRFIARSFPDVVHEVLCHFAQRTSFLAEVDDDTCTACLGFLDSFFDAKHQVRPTGTNIGRENVGSITFLSISVEEGEGEYIVDT
jgi:hypothetical protein